MGKYLLFVALAGRGHVNPTSPLVEELVRRGHRVDYATGAEHSEAVVEAGARWVPLPPLEPFVPPSEVGPDVVGSWLRHFFAALRATYPVLLEHCRAQRPDAICYDATNWPARLVAEKLAVPVVRSLPNLASNDAYSLDDQLTAGLGADHPTMVELAGDCADFSAEHDVELDVEGTMEVPEALNLVFVPRRFQPAGSSFDERFRFLGPLLGVRERAESWSPPESGGPVLYISLGTIFTDHPEFYRTCIEAFGDAWQVAMTVGNVPAEALGPIPPTFEVRSRFPQLAVLRHATAFLSHAGMNSVMESLHYAVPVVTLPQMPEQVANADRLRELGLGERLDTNTATPETLRAAVARVSSDPDVRGGLARMQQDIREGGGPFAARIWSKTTSADAEVAHRSTTPRWSFRKDQRGVAVNSASLVHDTPGP
ncbi:MGT family glycosyltransferase [Saccharopolyspora lacisalsi]|uniref:MGT family glycosyltransferase n=1 Tax=Halosaccharopolyspora lacisalsi TaxID=1000566 RepID=A0A839DUY1_9PSEU|nr:macrolide family glycosyltransferase [Halosaccharopolyspora lacisalsi]MBA8824720.1 MGT family glycosyltransferase [Halosaccharopolyspora lacisalsi]